MKVLGFDTSTMTTSVSIIEDENMLALYSLQGSVYHSESLSDMVNNILNKFDFDLSQIDLISVGIGPGSFTGIRIGLTFAKVMAQVLKKDIVAVSSLKACAIKEDGLVGSIIDARRGLIYACLMEDGKVLMDDTIIELEKFKDIVGDRKITLQGVDAKKFIHDFKNAKLGKELQMNAYYIALLGLKKFKEVGGDDFYKLVPNYLKLSQAEKNYADKNKTC
ncbi:MULTISPECIES: tRNA (adenosine(37)-N6)-threonylcarbamoyltransferase complex dimerization subunit type 1 TsaB [Peptoniphilus]|uniref:tRNA (adenosine(37)-N6)-threonylcarbamoyltransferase complex dimerization subunit type 1 TsaB n=1 Tax=Peptoniphilus TaxID=162289 RepID=UPI0001DCAB40|nr:tRNA (adenosine(37)-N6)-threonylcarbamoyltransferase complex dimerization subunit type 1 TsaB [Peptoniphilus sp. oral taxon 836]EFK39504.1 universal bacterial protein YeaZ [Peptoniphilus sp. oral taxon 836 str. F0141]